MRRAVLILATLALLSLPLDARIASPDEPHGRALDQARVVAVHDGDTITVRIGERREKVRLVGIDAPELDDERPDYREAGYAARDFARALLFRKTVTLERDARQPDRDKYTRLLRYVYLGDGTNVNEELVRRGYARVYRRFDFAMKREFKDAEAEAKREHLGLWKLPPGPTREVPQERVPAGGGSDEGGRVPTPRSSSGRRGRGASPCPRRSCRCGRGASRSS